MAVTFDSPSTDWQTLTQSTVNEWGNPFYPIYQNTTAVIYQKDYVQNTEYWTPMALDTVMQSNTLDGALSGGETTVTVDSTAGFPKSGRVVVGTDVIDYTGKTSTTFTGCSGVLAHSDGATIFTALYLVEETIPTELGGQMVKWSRRYGSIPDDWVDYDERPFTFPAYGTDDTSLSYRAAFTQNVNWKVTHTYYRTTDPYTDFPVSAQLFQVKDGGGAVVDFVDTGTTPSYVTYTGYVSASTLLNVSHNTLERYAGNIWVQKTYESKAL